MTETKHRNATRRGFATPEIDTNAVTGELAPPAAAPPTPAAAPAGVAPAAAEPARKAAIVGPSMADMHANTPVVEIEVIHQHGPAPNTDRPFQTLEVWTQNTIYVMDPTMQCVDVRERATHTPIANHKFVGRRLVGGQTRQGETIQLSYPYPRPAPKPSSRTRATSTVGSRRPARSRAWCCACT
jgi:hypothetical protein